MTQELPAVARLYYTGVGARRYKRASTQNGPGEPLCFVSLAEEALRRQRAQMQVVIETLRAELAMCPRDECICVKCGLRQDGQKQEATF